MTVIRAYEDLDGIADHLARLSDAAAETTIDRVQAAVLRLGEFPSMGTKVDESGLRPEPPPSPSVADTCRVIRYLIKAACFRS